jgi:anti-sigma B factor antagonist
MGTDAEPDDGAATRLRIEPQGGAAGELTLRLQGELDLVTAGVLRREIERHRPGAGPLVLDLSEVTFVDSTGLVLLMETTRQAAEAGWTLALRRGVSPAVARLLEITRTDGLFTWVGEPGS